MYILKNISYNVWGGSMLVIDKDQVNIREYQEVLKLESNTIMVKMENHDITIHGKDLHIIYLGVEEIVLKGIIQVVSL